MKRYSIFIIPLALFLALAPLPSAASGSGGGGDGGGDRDRDEAQEDTLGFDTASEFFARFFQGRGGEFLDLAIALNLELTESDSKPLENSPAQETWAEESQRLFVERVVAERARRNAERQAQEDEYYKSAENISDDDLPGLGSD